MSIWGLVILVTLTIGYIYHRQRKTDFLIKKIQAEFDQKTKAMIKDLTLKMEAQIALLEKSLIDRDKEIKEYIDKNLMYEESTDSTEKAEDENENEDDKNILETD